MKIRIVGPSANEGIEHQFLASFVVNDEIAIDAGCVGFQVPLDAQTKIQHVFLSHSHLDHIASLPCFLDNLFVAGAPCPTIYASESTLDTLRRDFFNDRVWPDLLRLSSAEKTLLKLVPLVDERSVEINGIKITPVSLDHVVPTFGFIVDSGDSAAAIVSDTAPTKKIWEIANNTPNLKAVFLEASFPNSMNWLAVDSMPLTPALFCNEAKKLEHSVRLIAIHIKPAFYQETVDELETLGLRHLEICRPATDYQV